VCVCCSMPVQWPPLLNALPRRSRCLQQHNTRNMSTALGRGMRQFVLQSYVRWRQQRNLVGWQPMRLLEAQHFTSRSGRRDTCMACRWHRNPGNPGILLTHCVVLLAKMQSITCTVTCSISSSLLPGPPQLLYNIHSVPPKSAVLAVATEKCAAAQPADSPYPDRQLLRCSRPTAASTKTPAALLMRHNSTHLL
jgi:hypothetical protein